MEELLLPGCLLAPPRKAPHRHRLDWLDRGLRLQAACRVDAAATVLPSKRPPLRCRLRMRVQRKVNACALPGCAC